MTSFAVPATVGSRLASIAARLPAKTAVVEGDARIEFAQLNASATTIAEAIVAAGGGSEGLVCLLFESKIAALKAIFGSARSGKAYIALDPSDPDERLQFILQDGQPVVLLTEAPLVARAQALAGGRCAIIDIDDTDPGAVKRALPEISADAPLYLIYTSGSTGQPKGVIQTQRNLLFFTDAFARNIGIAETDRLSLLFTLSFGAANMNVFGGLLNGATLCAYDMRRHGIPLLADWLDRERITVLHTVPTVFRELFLSLPPQRKLAHLRAIGVAGEAAFDSDIALFRRHTLEHCIFSNQLGATEASVIAQQVFEHRGPRPAPGILPAGRTPAGVRVLIIRDDGGEAQANEVGAIVVASRHVSPGYWRRPELDAAAFAPDPVERGVRRYASGDLGRIDAQGNLHFLGRSGSRVKIRGHSVDLTEVEAALSTCPGVIKAAVLAPQADRQREPDRLIAYLAVAANAERNPLQLRRRLGQTLPAYMLPSAFVFMTALPVTSRGKIDRTALAAMKLPPPDAQGAEALRDDLERAIAGVFEQLLKQPVASRYDDFFLLGGDSLSVVELQTRLRDVFGAAPASFYDDTTVAGVASGIRASRVTAPAAARPIPVLIPLRETGNEPPLFLVHGRLGQALVSPHFLQLLGNEQPVWAFQVRGLDGLQPPHATIEAMAADYVVAMQARRPAGPYFIGALCAGALVALEIAHRLRDAGETVLPLLLLDPPDRPFAMADSRITEDAMIARLKTRKAMGSIAAPVDDPVYARAAARAALAFEKAIRNYRPRPYDGHVYMLSSRDRMETADPDHLRSLFTGCVERFEVAATHVQVLDPHNPVFASGLAHCLDAIRAWLVSPPPAPELVQSPGALHP
jgi:amino acid adenylation domain-containing protein